MAKYFGGHFKTLWLSKLIIALHRINCSSLWSATFVDQSCLLLINSDFNLQSSYIYISKVLFD